MFNKEKEHLTGEGCVGMAIPWQLCRTIGPLTLRSQEMFAILLKSRTLIAHEHLLIYSMSMQQTNGQMCIAVQSSTHPGPLFIIDRKEIFLGAHFQSSLYVCMFLYC